MTDMRCLIWMSVFWAIVSAGWLMHLESRIAACERRVTVLELIMEDGGQSK